MSVSPKVPESTSKTPKTNTNLASKIFTCSICSDNYDDNKKVPIILNCGHTICKSCIVISHTRICPYCSSSIQGGLIKNYELINMMHQVETINLCPIHEKEASVICCNHKKLMCSVCILEKDKHHKHCEFTHFEKMFPQVEDRWASYQKYKQEYRHLSISYPEYLRSKKEELKETITEKFSDLLSNISLSISYKMVNAFKLIDAHFLNLETQIQLPDYSKTVEEIDMLAKQFTERYCLSSGLKILSLEAAPVLGEPPSLKEVNEDLIKNKRMLEDFCGRLLQNVQGYVFDVKFRKNKFVEIKQRLTSSVSPISKRVLHTQPTSNRTEHSMRSSQLKAAHQGNNHNESTNTTNQLYEVVMSSTNTPITHGKK